MAIGCRAAFRLFQRYGYRRAYLRRAGRQGAPDAWPESFQGLVRSMDTPFRLAGFMEENLFERSQTRLFDVPQPAVVTWREGGGNSADWAQFALEVLAWHGYETYLFTVLHARRCEAQTVCVVKDPGSAGWFHLSPLGIFGLYEDWEALADDLLAEWGMRFVRDVYMRLVDERVRQR